MNHNLEADLNGEISSHLDESERILGISVKDLMSYVLFSVLLNYREILGKLIFKNLKCQDVVNFLRY